jgi:hypothetical protein
LNPGGQLHCLLVISDVICAQLQAVVNLLVKLSLGPARPEPGGGVCVGDSSDFCAAARHVRNGGYARASQDWVLGIR